MEEKDTEKDPNELGIIYLRNINGKEFFSGRAFGIVPNTPLLFTPDSFVNKNGKTIKFYRISLATADGEAIR